MLDLQLTPQLFVIFANLIEEASGLHYGPNDRELLEAKLAMQAVDAGHQSLLDFYYRLRYDDPDGSQVRDLIQGLVVHETYFFRELAPVETLVDGHLAHVVATRGRARVWSAACSTGEEPLTLAMLLAERGMLDRVEIVASDISEAALARARAGRHSRRSLRDGHPAHLARRYLDVTAHAISVDPKIRAAVDLRQVNLMSDTEVGALGTFDAILCRNVLIYFRDAQISTVVRRLTGALHHDGVLLVGISESLLRFGTALVCEEQRGSFFYRRRR